MINVLYVSHKFRPGTHPLFKSQLNLDPEKFRCVVCFLSGESDTETDLEKAGYRVYFLRSKAKNVRWYNFSLISRLKKILEDEQIQVVNCQQHRTTPIGVLAAQCVRHKPAVVTTLHGLGLAGDFKRKLLNFLLYKKVFKVIGISEGVSKDILASNWGLAPDKVTTIQNGLEFDGFPAPVTKQEARRSILPGFEDGFWYGTAGRLSEVKNHQNLLLAFAQVVEKCPQSRLLIAGEGHLDASLKELASSLGISEKVHFLGFRKDIPLFLRGLDVFLLPSLREGLPLSLLEAMASGLPVIAASVGGIPEVMGNADAGRLIDPAKPDQIASAMVEMAGMPEDKLAEMGSRGRHRALNDFNAAKMIGNYERVYQQACDSRSSGAEP